MMTFTQIEKTYDYLNKLNESKLQGYVEMNRFTQEIKAFFGDKFKDNELELLVIGGDTLVYFDGQVLGKPKNEEDAYRTLKRLQGNKNEVYSAFTIILKKNNEIIKETSLSKSIVTMKSMSDEQIKQYIKTGEPMDKAGSYAIQGIGSKFIENIEGSYSSVVGLDVEKLKELLRNYLGKL